MISAFPHLYPDEMISSGWARYEAWVCYPQRYNLLEELLGHRKALAHFDLLGRLGHFTASLPPGHPNTNMEELISHHTLLPFYTAFLPEERRVFIHEQMGGTHPVNIHALLGLTLERPAMPRSLRFCPCCVAEDREQFGEAFWHRVHHLPGVVVCPHHAVWLENTQSPLWLVHGPTTFVTAETVVVPTEARPVNLENPVERQFLRLAHNARWLLEYPDLNLEAFCLDDRFHLQLAQRGLATYSRRRKLRQTLLAFRAMFPSELLELIGCEWQPDVQDDRCWVARILRNNPATTFALYRLLLVLFFTEDVNTFLQLPTKLKPFGDGPWPCLNPVCEHDHQRHITHYDLDFNHKGLPRGTFTCDCGFVYSRIGPDNTQEDLYRIGEVKVRGELWQQKLQKLWLDPDVTLTQMQRTLRSHWNHLRRHGLLLGLPFPPPGVPLSLHTATPTDIGDGRRRQTPTQDPSPFRETWLQAVRQYPDAGITILRQKIPKCYSWLIYYDNLWLEKHVPAQKKYPKRRTHIDWTQRDSELEEFLKAAFERLQTRQEVPFRISPTALLTETGRRNFFIHNRERLPASEAVVKQLAENWDDFRIRRIWHAARKMYAEGLVVRRRILMEIAGLRTKLLNERPLLQEAMDAALLWLQEGDMQL
jgi:hypothetical protein